MIEHEAREQQAARVAAPLVRLLRLPGERDGAGDVIEHAGGAARFRLVLALPRDLLRQRDGALDRVLEAVAMRLRRNLRLADAREKIGAERAFGVMTTDGARDGIERDDIARALQIEPR